MATEINPTKSNPCGYPPGKNCWIPPSSGHRPQKKTENNDVALYAGIAVGTALLLGSRDPVAGPFFIGAAVAAACAAAQNSNSLKNAVVIGAAVAAAPVIVPAVATAAAVTAVVAAPVVIGATLIAAPVVMGAALVAKAAAAPILLTGLVLKTAAVAAFPPLLPLMILASLKK